MALNELLGYDWNYEPSAQKAVEYGNTHGEDNRKALGEEAERSWEYIHDYKKLMWLCWIAYDYCRNAIDSIDYIMNGGVANA